jgi:deoxyribodipyrimidine photolyase-like uncharacterized protein
MTTEAGHTGNLRLILGDQLNPEHTWFQVLGRRVVYALREVRQETDDVRHLSQKILISANCCSRHPEKQWVRGSTGDGPPCIVHGLVKFAG